MSDDLKGVVITTLVSGFISIIGFIITIISMKKSFSNELRNQRNNIALEKMSTIPYAVLELMNEMIHSKKDNDCIIKSVEKFNEILNIIYSYGSKKAISIAALLQEINYNIDINTDKYRLIAIYVLLATQIKYDVTEIIVNPELWFKMRITDYSINKNSLKISNNRLVDELNLSKNFKIN